MRFQQTQLYFHNNYYTSKRKTISLIIKNVYHKTQSGPSEDSKRNVL